MLFNHLGWPWPEHRDVCVPYAFRSFMATSGASPEEAREHLYDWAAQKGLQVPDRLVKDLIREARLAQRGQVIVEMDAREGPRDVIGTIKAVNPRVNFLKRFDLSDTRLSKQLIGRLGKQPFTELIVMEDVDDTIVGEYRLFAPEALVEDAGLKQGDGVALSIRPYGPPGREPVWVVEEVFVRGG